MKKQMELLAEILSCLQRIEKAVCPHVTTITFDKNEPIKKIGNSYYSNPFYKPEIKKQ
jgi:hypothetical protein